jgi:hypothetical protein
MPLLSMIAGASARPSGPRGLTRKEFREAVYAAFVKTVGYAPFGRDVVLVSRLRRALPEVSFLAFNRHLLALDRDGVVELLPAYYDPRWLDTEDRRNGLCLPGTGLRPFVRWMAEPSLVLL